jgi:hypothetical protein
VSAPFAHKAKIPNLNDTKNKEGYICRSQMRELMRDKQFCKDLNENESNAWLSFKRICKDFF